MLSIFEVSQIPIVNERKTLNEDILEPFAQAENIFQSKPESSVQKIRQKDKQVFKPKGQTADPMAQIERDTVNSFWLFGLNFNSMISKISFPSPEDENQLSETSSN